MWYRFSNSAIGFIFKKNNKKWCRPGNNIFGWENAGIMNISFFPQIPTKTNLGKIDVPYTPKA